MSKILRRCLSLVLVVMLLASLTISGSLTASADNKTGDGLAAHAMNAYYEGWKYVWGGASYGAVDCSGLIYSYVGGGARTSEDMLGSSPESGYVSNGVPDIPGLGLWQPGHVGVYVGGGMAVDARDEISNVCYQSVSSKSWVMWFKVSGVSYGNDSSVANDNQSASDTESSDIQPDSDSEAEEEPEVLSLGSTGPEVRKLQERLKELGYFEGNTTEYFGYVTEGALIEFQIAAGLDANGIYDETVKEALFSDSAPVKPVQNEEDSDSEEQPETSESDLTEESEEVSETVENETQNENNDPEVVSDPEETQQDSEEGIFAEFEEYQTDVTDSNENTDSDENVRYPNTVYQKGDEGSEIADIQYILIKLGYFDYAVTGYFCDNTADAVARFQLDNDLNPTGYIDDTTLALIYSKYDSRNEEPVSEDTATDEENSDTEASSGAEVIFDADLLRFGMSGDKILKLQKSLVIWGYLSYGDVSELGYFDEATENAVISAQKSFGMEQSGVVTKELEKALDEGNSTSETETVTAGNSGSSDLSSDAEKTASETESTVSSSASVSQSSNSETSSQSVAVVETGIGDYFSKTIALIVIAVSAGVIFFAGTVHYWNVSMEKRRQRARKATTVSAYRRRSM